MLREELSKILKEYDFSPRKRLGQNFLINEKVLSREVEYARADGCEVLEIGAGTGFLTRELAKRAKKVIAIEKDALLFKILRDVLSTFKNIELINGDFLEQEVDEAEVIASNVPYSISSPLTFKIAEIKFERALLCYQKEFAQRMVAQPNTRDYSRLSVMAQLDFKVSFLETVPRNSFYPAPEVDSAIIMLTPKEHALDDFSKKIITLLFQHKKKSVRNALVDSSYYLKLKKDKIREICERISNKNKKVISLSKEEIIEVAGELKEAMRL
jgi:16S rRNA (adenine1518-N6/adenine1519-N6)-dimethyltransferase